MSVQSNGLRALGWLVAGPFGGVLLFYLLVLAVNARDKPPSRQAQALARFHSELEPVPDADNGYVYAMGFGAEPREHLLAAGVRRVAEARRLAESANAPQMRDYGAGYDFKKGRSDAVNRLSEACRTVTRECVSALDHADDTVRDWLTADQWLLDRYRALLAHPHWRSTVPFTQRTPIPPYTLMMEGQRLLLARAWRLAGIGDAFAVKDLLEEDLFFWRRVLASSDILITKMTAVSAINRHFAWSNLVMRRLPPHAVVTATPLGWLHPMSEAERDMGLCLTGEWVFASRTVRETKQRVSLVPDARAGDSTSIIGEVVWRAIRPMLQPQDSSNRLADVTIAVAKRLRAPYGEYPQALQRVRNVQRYIDEEYTPFSRMFNVTGDVMFAWGKGKYEGYGARVTDLEGVRRLAAVTAELRGRGVSAAEVAKALADSDLHDPYTDKPFTWDEKGGAIAFTGLEPGERGRHAFAY